MINHLRILVNLKKFNYQNILKIFQKMNLINVKNYQK